MNKELNHYKNLDEPDMMDIRYYIFTRKDFAQKYLEAENSSQKRELEKSIDYINSRLKELIFFDEA